MQQVINLLYNLYLTIHNGRTVLANKYLFVIGVCIATLFVMLLVVYNNNNKKVKMLEYLRKALNEGKRQVGRLLIQKQKAEQDLQALNTKLMDLMKKYDKLSSNLKKEKAKLVNLQENLTTYSAALVEKNKIINHLTKEVEILKQEQIEEANAHRDELDHVTVQMKTALKTLESKQRKTEEENKSIVLINENLTKKDEDSQYIISSLQNDIDHRNAFIAELEERIQSLNEKLKDKDDVLKLKEAEVLSLGEQLNSMISKISKQKSNPFERLANW